MCLVIKCAIWLKFHVVIKNYKKLVIIFFTVRGSYGSVTFPDLEPGRYRVRARARGHDLLLDGHSRWHDISVL